MAEDTQDTQETPQPKQKKESLFKKGRKAVKSFLDGDQDNIVTRIMGNVRALDEKLYDQGEEMARLILLDERVTWQRAFPVAGAVGALFVMANPDVVDITPKWLKKFVADKVGGGAAEEFDNLALAAGLILLSFYLFKKACPEEVVADARRDVEARWKTKDDRKKPTSGQTPKGTAAKSVASANAETGADNNRTVW